MSKLTPWGTCDFDKVVREIAKHLLFKPHPGEKPDQLLIDLVLAARALDQRESEKDGVLPAFSAWEGIG